MSLKLRRINSISCALLVCLVTIEAQAAGNYSMSQAVESISVPDIKEHVKVLASDTFEGREAGSQGGRAAGVYLGEQYRKNRLAGGAGESGYYQDFSGGYRNILGVIRGTDPKLQEEVIVLGAHYDHVGYGTAENSRGPTGYIHNGADDNASGTAALIEIAEAISNLKLNPRRTILFALWDAEEKGLWGSAHWAGSPTVPSKNIKMMINVDMIGRLRRGLLTCYGTRTCSGLRRIISEQNPSAGLKLDYTWELPDNSDHWPFVQQRIPVLMFHTGLHDEYHTPNDDLDKVNYAGARDVARLMFRVTWDLANRDQIAPFRGQALSETINKQRAAERGLPPRPGRLGVKWSDADGVVKIDQIRPGSAAQRAGLQVGDRIEQIDGHSVEGGAEFLKGVLAAPSPAEFVVRRSGAEEPTAVQVELDGKPVRLGISWRTDDADPSAIVLTRVVPGSPAAQAGLKKNDRIYQIGGESIPDARQLQADRFFRDSLLKLRVGRQGYLQTVEIDLGTTSGQ